MAVEAAELSTSSLRVRIALLLDKADGTLAALGLGWLASMLRLAIGDRPRDQLKALWPSLGIPILALLGFCVVWAQVAPRIDTRLGAVPGPAAVWQEAKNLIADHRAERERRAAFYERQRERNAALLAKNPNAEVRIREYTGRPTYLDQIVTSLTTVFAGFVLAALIAVPLGVMAGLSKTVSAAVNPLVQIFKPVSPLAWLPLATMVVSAVHGSAAPLV